MKHASLALLALLCLAAPLDAQDPLTRRLGYGVAVGYSPAYQVRGSYADSSIDRRVSARPLVAAHLRYRLTGTVGVRVALEYRLRSTIESATGDTATDPNMPPGSRPPLRFTDSREYAPLWIASFGVSLRAMERLEFWAAPAFVHEPEKWFRCASPGCERPEDPLLESASHLAFGAGAHFAQPLNRWTRLTAGVQAWHWNSAPVTTGGVGMDLEPTWLPAFLLGFEIHSPRMAHR